MYEVLVAIDDNEERALAQAEAMIGLPESAENVRAVLFHVFTDNPQGASMHQLTSTQSLREVLEDAGIEVSMEEASGNPSEEILKRAREMDVDLVSVAGRGRSPAGKALLGSVSQKVLLDANRPVLFTAVDENTR